MGKRIGILTGGGDCPGLNAVIRAVVKKAIIDHDMEVIGIEDGYEGAIRNRYRNIESDSKNHQNGIFSVNITYSSGRKRR